MSRLDVSDVVKRFGYLSDDLSDGGAEAVIVPWDAALTFRDSLLLKDFPRLVAAEAGKACALAKVVSGKDVALTYKYDGVVVGGAYLPSDSLRSDVDRTQHPELLSELEVALLGSGQNFRRYKSRLGETFGFMRSDQFQFQFVSSKSDQVVTASSLSQLLRMPSSNVSAAGTIERFSREAGDIRVVAAPHSSVPYVPKDTGGLVMLVRCVDDYEQPPWFVALKAVKPASSSVSSSPWLWNGKPYVVWDITTPSGLRPTGK